MKFTLRMKKYFVADWLGKVLVAHRVLPLSVLSLSMTHEEGRAVSALVSICWVFLVFHLLYQTIIHLSKWGWGDTLGLRARLPISLTNFHINHLSLGRTGLLTFHKLAHTTCSETRWRWRWRWQTGCRQVDRLCSPINPVPWSPSPWSAFLAHLPPFPLLPLPLALLLWVSDSRRLSNWPQNVPGNRARSRGRSPATLHSEKLSLPVNDRHTDREGEWKRGAEKDREATELKGNERSIHLIAFSFHFISISIFNQVTIRHDTTRRGEKSINVKLESVHTPQKTIELFAKKFPFPFCSLFLSLSFSWSPAKALAHTFSFALPFESNSNDKWQYN